MRKYIGGKRVRRPFFNDEKQGRKGKKENLWWMLLQLDGLKQKGCLNSSKLQQDRPYLLRALISNLAYFRSPYY